ncbi:MAG: pyridoxamine 5'-phosphate oxidase family protein [Paracoccaceae bacterium]
MTDRYQTLKTLDELEALYGAPAGAAVTKVVTRLSPLYAKWIAASRFCVLSTVGPEGTDASPRGDEGPVVELLDPATLLLPDWRGNQRIDSLRNIVRDGRASLMFLVPGVLEVMRVNGRAELSTDPALLGRFSDRGRAPKLVLIFHIAEAYPQCARSLLRSELWKTGDQRAEVPGMSDFLAEIAAREAGEAAEPVETGRDRDDEIHRYLGKDMW